MSTIYNRIIEYSVITLSSMNLVVTLWSKHKIHGMPSQFLFSQYLSNQRPFDI